MVNRWLANSPDEISTGIAIVPQGRRIFKSLTVRENLCMPPTSALAVVIARPIQPASNGISNSALGEFPQLAERMDNTGNA